MVIVVNNGTNRKTDEIIPIRCLFAFIAASNVETQVLIVQLYVEEIDVHTEFVE